MQKNLNLNLFFRIRRFLMSEKELSVINNESADDEALFARFKGGDHSAFDLLLKRYQAPIFSLILKSVGNRQSAEELFQDVFFKIIEKRDSFRTDVSFRAWLFTVCRNTCIDTARKNKRAPGIDSIFVDEEKPLEIRQAGNNPGPLEGAAGAQLDSFLEEALRELPPQQRETFYLKVKGEMTFEEIGAVMKCSVNTAKSRLRYAAETLRGIFGKRGYLK
ncbi:MAG: sigma-70 family RNA polymerase sigma factor [Deltaproteobacteria bacterium]|nr:sigma-70 family RNA polymerase sigma factor [Deltaproteobacteria bacterium]